ncbi:DUF4179 domain-containing protein [Solibacillus sp. FSL K6-4121]|uniref:DUF4179 domain-containing protein n=1 Tax=Solibacillus sp. FSL K6-4121 TaxID=2921505 RepID=UPI0030FB5B60
MKNLYKQFNDIDINITEYEEMDVTEFENAQFKKEMKNRISKKKTKKWMKSISAACLSLGIASASIVGLSYTAFAQEIPILNSILKLFSDREMLTGYDELAEQHHLTAESGGNSITVNEILFDSKSLFVTYFIETEQDLGETPMLAGSIEVNGKRHALPFVDHTLKKTGENQYAGLTKAVLQLDASLEEGDFTFHMSSMTSTDKKDFVQLETQFDFYAKATDNVTQIVDKEATDEDLILHLEKVTYTPLSFIVNFNSIIKDQTILDEWPFISSGFHVTDDLGNTYETKMNGGAGSGSHDMSYMFTYEKLHSDAKTLTFNPYFELLAADKVLENGVLYRDHSSNAPKKTVELEEITINIKR